MHSLYRNNQKINLKGTCIAFLHLLFLSFPVIVKAQQEAGHTYIGYKTKWLSYASKGRFDSALYFIQKCQFFADSQPRNWVQRAFTHVGQAITYEAMNNANEACHQIQNAMQLFETKALPEDSSTLCHNLYAETLWQFIDINQQVGNYNQAQGGLIKYYQLAEGRKDTVAYVKAQAELAKEYLYFGEYPKALAIFDSLEVEMAHGGKETGNGIITPFSLYMPMAQMYMETGNKLKALDYITRAMDFCCNEQQLKKQDYLALHDMAPAAIALAENYRLLGNNSSAQQLLNLLAARVGNNPLLGEAHAGILLEKANILLDDDKYSEAKTFLVESRSILDTLQPRSDYYNAILLNLAMVQGVSKEYGAADTLLQNEADYYNSKGLRSTFAMQKTLVALGRNLALEGKYHEAADTLIAAGQLAVKMLTSNFAGMSEAEKLQYNACFDDLFDALYTVLQHSTQTDKSATAAAFNLQLQRKGLVGKSEAYFLNTLRHDKDTAIARMCSNWLSTRQLLAKQYSLPTVDRFLNTDSLEQESEELEKKLSLNDYNTSFLIDRNYLPQFAQQSQNIANIEFVRYKNNNSLTYAAFVIHAGDSIPVFVPLCTESALLHLVRGYNGVTETNEQLAAKLYTSGSIEANELYLLIWQPLEKYLSGTQIINYSTAGLLNNIAFAAISCHSGFAGNAYNLHCLANLTESFTKSSLAMPPAEINIWGNINYDTAEYTMASIPGNAVPGAALLPQGLHPALFAKGFTATVLPNFTTHEPDIIKDQFAAKHIHAAIFEGSQATEDNFKQTAHSLSGILHISTHGFYADYNRRNIHENLPESFISSQTNPLFRCGLAFAGVNKYLRTGQTIATHDDGILTGYEISQLDLHNVQLVTLSACETGLGNITATEGNLGLQHAFKLSGVKNMLVSLWQVPAKETAILLKDFYAHWLKGRQPAAALQAAQKDLQQQAYPPYYWAGFVLIE
ncbi:MAG TPA: CHAT domain-containing protein [Chitinophagaceae bacterium]|nr:CHAT domain-containing protein [Chitinophagaceae bacterium]